MLEGKTSLQEGVEAVRRDTRAYARRQSTWFRHQLPRDAVFVDAARPPEELAQAIARCWRSRAGAGQAARAASSGGRDS